MEEDSGDLPRPRGIQLVSSGDVLKRTGSDFDGLEHFIPALGKVQLTGCRAHQYQSRDIGLTFKDGTLVSFPAAALQRQGLYDISVGVLGRREPVVPVVCTMILPNGLSIASTLSFGEDDIQTNDHRFYGDTDRWTKPVSKQKYLFFASDSPDFLSQLNFQFTHGTS